MDVGHSAMEIHCIMFPFKKDGRFMLLLTHKVVEELNEILNDEYEVFYTTEGHIEFRGDDFMDFEDLVDCLEYWIEEFNNRNQKSLKESGVPFIGSIFMDTLNNYLNKARELN